MLKGFFLFVLLVFSSVRGDYLTPAPLPVIAPDDVAHNFRGYDFKLGVGYAGTSSKVTAYSSDKAVKNIYDLGGAGASIQTKLSASTSFGNRWIVSYSIYGQYNTDQATESQTINSILQEKRKMWVTWNVGFDGRIGYLFSGHDLILIYLGPDWGLQRLSYTNQSVTEKFSKFALGPRFGVGAKRKMGEHLLALVCFDYAWYPTRTYIARDGTATKIKANLATMIISLGYLF